MNAVLSAAILVSLALVGCSRSSEGTVQSAGHSRYAGVGLYPAGPLWSKMRMHPDGRDAATSRLADDEEIIVAIDQTTGEVRQCGNLSGICIGMNPWTTPLSKGAQTPVALTKRAEPAASDPKTPKPAP